MSQSAGNASKYAVKCAKCGHPMFVMREHFGRMCKCKQCGYPIYVTPDSVSPPMDPRDLSNLRCFSEEKRVPVSWRSGDLLMDKYEVRGTLGNGGMGVVYQVFHRGWGIDLAVKSPLPRLLPNRHAIELFEQECETWICMAPHPNTVCCYYVLRLGGIPRVFVEYIKGHSLSHKIASKTIYEGGHRKALQRILDMSIQFAWGLQHAHEEGLVHQDVKPSNALVSVESRLKVTDFGVARALMTEDTGKGDLKYQAVGTPTHRSPDHLHPDGVTVKSDMWSWAMCVMEMFAGGRFWDKGDTAPESLRALKKHGAHYDEIPPMPDEVFALLKRCFAIEPAERPDDMNAAANELRHIYQQMFDSAYPREVPSLGDITPDVLSNRAVSLLDLGKAEEAEKLWNDAFKEIPSHLPSRYNVNLYHWRTGKLTDIEFVHRLYKYCGQHGHDWRPRFLLARVFMEMGANSTAVELLESIPSIGGYHRDVAFALAMAQNKRKFDKKMLHEFLAHSSAVTAVALSNKGNRGVSGCVDGKIRLWDTMEQRCIAILAGHTGQVNTIRFSAEDDFIISAGDDATARVWDARSGECLRVLARHDGPVSGADISKDGQTIVTASADWMVRHWNMDALEPVKVFRGHEGAVLCVALDPFATFAISGGQDCTLRMWNLKTGESIRTLREEDPKPYSCVELSADPSTAIAVSRNRICIWNIKKGELHRSFIAHKSFIGSLSLSRSGDFALTGTPTGTLKLWDTVNVQCIRSLKGCAPAALSGAGHVGISGNAEGKVQIWAIHATHDTFAAPYMICHSAEVPQNDDKDKSTPSEETPESENSEESEE